MKRHTRSVFWHFNTNAMGPEITRLFAQNRYFVSTLTGHGRGILRFLMDSQIRKHGCGNPIHVMTPSSIWLVVCIETETNEIT